MTTRYGAEKLSMDSDHNGYYVHPYQPFPFAEFAAIVGGHNWVLARRSPRILMKYGSDVVCLSHARYIEAERLARLRRTEGFD